MEIRSILVHLDAQEQTPVRVAAAAALARRHEAHLIGLAPTDWVMVPADYSGLPGAGDYLQATLGLLRRQAQESVRRFEAQVKALGLSSYEGRMVEDNVSAAMTLAARYCDLSVVTQTEPGRWSAAQQAGMPESVLLHSGRPLLALPYAGADPTLPLDGRIVVAWDGGREAARAMHDALPLLRQARTVEVLVFESSAGGDPRHGPLPGADIGLWLARHGLRVEVRQMSTAMPVGEALISHAVDVEAQLIVAGGYGHTRLRETVLGGVTRTLLRSSPVPLLLAH
ncbi:universal stress protein [Roseateles violae]|uniref:Universal stress protein n=1 Tax=Roseateles violae TaxID=3058042 RepID=A0ABT8DV81_9BURK|nr:universal stress protein [Pelomonas sp. PFR6]MDN3922220.1 universal stress protein [Pelomonas sp. PFR6]